MGRELRYDVTLALCYKLERRSVDATIALVNCINRSLRFGQVHFGQVYREQFKRLSLFQVSSRHAQQLPKLLQLKLALACNRGVRNGAKVHGLQRALGRASIATMGIYLHADEELEQAAAIPSVLR